MSRFTFHRFSAKSTAAIIIHSTLCLVSQVAALMLGFISAFSKRQLRSFSTAMLGDSVDIAIKFTFACSTSTVPSGAPAIVIAVERHWDVGTYIAGMDSSNRGLASCVIFVVVVTGGFWSNAILDAWIPVSRVFIVHRFDRLKITHKYNLYNMDKTKSTKLNYE